MADLDNITTIRIRAVELAIEAARGWQHVSNGTELLALAAKIETFLLRGREAKADD